MERSDNKIVFLDIDGVVCLYPEWQQDWCGNQNDRLSELCCRNLAAVLDATGAKIVITSSWRLSENDMNNLLFQMEQCGLPPNSVVGQTRDFCHVKTIKTHNELRWAEIKDYIESNGTKNYVIIDDFNLEKYDKEHLVRTKKHEGLTARLRDVCIRKLGGEL